jgi:hypothetical protein
VLADSLLRLMDANHVRVKSQSVAVVDRVGRGVVSLVIDIIFATLDARMTPHNTTKISEATQTHTHTHVPIQHTHTHTHHPAPTSPTF